MFCFYFIQLLPLSSRPFLFSLPLAFHWLSTLSSANPGPHQSPHGPLPYQETVLCDKELLARDPPVHCKKPNRKVSMNLREKYNRPHPTLFNLTLIFTGIWLIKSWATKFTLNNTEKLTQNHILLSQKPRQILLHTFSATHNSEGLSNFSKYW